MILKEHSFLGSVIDFCSDRLTYTLNSYQVLCNQIRGMHFLLDVKKIEPCGRVWKHELTLDEESWRLELFG